MNEGNMKGGNGAKQNNSSMKPHLKPQNQSKKHNCEYCGGQMSEKYWDIEFFTFREECEECGRSQNI